MEGPIRFETGVMRTFETIAVTSDVVVESDFLGSIVQGGHRKQGDSERVCECVRAREGVGVLRPTN